MGDLSYNTGSWGNHDQICPSKTDSDYNLTYFCSKNYNCGDCPDCDSQFGRVEICVRDYSGKLDYDVWQNADRCKPALIVEGTDDAEEEDKDTDWKTSVPIILGFFLVSGLCAWASKKMEQDTLRRNHWMSIPGETLDERLQRMQMYEEIERSMIRDREAARVREHAARIEAARRDAVREDLGQFVLREWERDRLRQFDDDAALGIQQARVSMLIKKKESIERRRSTVKTPMQQSMIGTTCSICTLEFEPGQDVMVFACHRTHMVHEDCFKELKEFAQKKKSKLTCPICRKPVKQGKIVKKKLVESEAIAGVYDPFAVQGNIPRPPPVVGPDPARLGGPEMTNKVGFEP